MDYNEAENVLESAWEAYVKSIEFCESKEVRKIAERNFERAFNRLQKYKNKNKQRNENAPKT